MSGNVPTPGEEHEFEAEHGLPEPLPPGERLLWQGAPVFAALLERVFHIRTLAIYFAVILLARAVTVWAQGSQAVDGVVAMLWLLPAALFTLGIVATLAWLTHRTTVYTITDRRVVMRVGIVLTVTYNLPFTRIGAADVRFDRGSTGEIALALEGADRIAYLHLWPHARPWHLRRTQPMLRCVDDAATVARLLSDAWGRARGLAASDVRPVATPRPEASPFPAAGIRGPAGLSTAR